jgi:hypothetical protein
VKWRQNKSAQHRLHAGQVPRIARPAKTAGQAGQATGSLALMRSPLRGQAGLAIPSAALLGQVWSQGKVLQQGAASSPDRTAKLALYSALGFIHLVGETTPVQPLGEGESNVRFHRETS